jgi:predicted ester cyclase
MVLVGSTATMAQSSSQAEENKAFIREYAEALSGNEKTEAMLDRYISDEALKQHIREFEAAFPRYEFIAEDMIAEGDKVAVHFTARGTHEGQLYDLEATGRSFEIPGLIIYRIENGKIAEFWLQADVMGLMQQLTAE